MKIVHIITRLILGGAQENTLITCRLLAARGHDVTLITGPALGPEGELFNQTRDQKYKTIVLPELRRAILPVHDLIAYRKLKKILADLNPDIVHTHSAKAGILGRFAAHAMRNHRGWHGQKRSVAMSYSRPVIVHTIHGLAFGSFAKPFTNKFYIALERAAAKRTDAFISVADAMTAQALAAGIGSPQMYTTAYSAIEENDFLTAPPPDRIAAFRAKYDLPPDALVLITLARLTLLKGHEYIIESARTLAPKFPNAYWLFVGNGALTDQLKNSVAQLGLADRFRFTGLLPPSEVPLAIHASDILVHCSLREGLARALPQAMLCSKPVISFDNDGAPEVVNRNTGRLMPAKDVPSLAAACAELLADASLRQNLGRTARASVIKKFAPDTMLDTIESVYKKVSCS